MFNSTCLSTQVKTQYEIQLQHLMYVYNIMKIVLFQTSFVALTINVNTIAEYFQGATGSAQAI